MDPAIQPVADRVEAALALVCDAALRAAARRRDAASTTRRLLVNAINGMETACAALSQGLLLRPATVRSLLAMLVDESASRLESRLAVATCTRFSKVSSCLQQVRPWEWCSCCKQQETRDAGCCSGRNVHVLNGGRGSASLGSDKAYTFFACLHLGSPGRRLATTSSDCPPRRPPPDGRRRVCPGTHALGRAGRVQ